MLAWVSDPVVRFGLKHSLASVRLLPLIPLIIGELEDRSAGRPLRIALYLLCCAAPAAAAYLLEMEHNGQLDQIRLSGRSPSRVVTTALLTMAGPWLAGALLFFGWAALRPVHVSNVWLIAAIVGMSVSVSALSTTIGFSKERVDPRVGLVALAAIGVVTGIGAIDAIFSAPNRIHAAMPYVLAIELLAIGWSLRGLNRRIAFPPSMQGGARRMWLRPSRFFLRWPGFYRGATLASSGAMLGLLFVPALLVLRYFTQAFTGETMVFYAPVLVIGMLAVSLICREDATVGRLDVIRMSSRAPWRTTCELMAGLWAPFVVTTAVLAAVVALLFSVSRFGLLSTVGLLAIAAPLPLVEGWSRFWPGTFYIPYALALVVMRGTGSFIGFGGLIALAWWAAVSRFRDSDRPVLDGWVNVAVTAVLCALPLTHYTTSGMTASLMALAPVTIAISPLLIHMGPLTTRERFAQTIAILIAVMTGAAPIWGIQQAAAAGVAGALAWEATFRIQRSGLPSPAQALARLATVAAVSLVFDAWSQWISLQRTAVEALIGGVGYYTASLVMLYATRLMVSRQQRLRQ